MSCTRFGVRSMLAVVFLAAPSWAQSFDELVARGDAALRAVRHDEAIAAYSAALALQPEVPRVLTARGTAHAARGELRLAQHDFEKAHELDAAFVRASDELIALGQRMAPAAEAIRMAQARESLADSQLWRWTFEEPGKRSSSSQIALQPPDRVHSVSASPGAVLQFVTIGDASWTRHSVDPWEPVGQRLSPPLPPRFDDPSRAWLGAREVGRSRGRGRDAVEYEFYSAHFSADTRVRLLVDAETGYPVRYETIDIVRDGVEPVSGVRESWEVRYDLPVVIEDPTKAARAEPGPLTVDDARALIARLPSLSGLAGDLEITQMGPSRQGRPDTDYLVEARWSASGQRTFGLAVIAPLAAFPPWLEYLAQATPWGLLAFEPNRGFVDLLADLQKRRKEAHESGALGDLRMMVSGQIAFSVNHGYRYAPSVECLLQPATCCREHPGEEVYVSDNMAGSERLGYRFTLHVGPTVRLESGASGPASFAYTAVPTTPGAGAAFCVDDRGEICRVDSGEGPAVEGGRCRRDTACRSQR